MSDPADRAHFLNLAALFEGGMFFAALLLGWAFGVDIVSHFRPELVPSLIGLAAALPPFLVLLATDRFKFAPLERIRQIIEETLGPSLSALYWYDLILVAATAGLGEELLFRGVVQPLFERWTASLVFGLLASNVVFGLLHALTPTYAVLAGLMGLYFGLLAYAAGGRNLMTPILAHGLYDYLAFLLVIRGIRSRPPRAGRTTASPADDSTRSAQAD